MPKHIPLANRAQPRVKQYQPQSTTGQGLKEATQWRPTRETGGVTPHLRGQSAADHSEDKYGESLIAA